MANKAGNSYGHRNKHDRGVLALFRYARLAKRMWRSELNDAVVSLVDPQRHETVVDIGAGVGAGSIAAARAGAAVRAVEPTPYMRWILRIRQAFVRPSRRIRILDGAAENTGLDLGIADAVLAVNTMHHWTNMKAGTFELARILAPGGRIVLADDNFDNPNHPDHANFKKRHKSDSHQRRFEMVDVKGVADLFSKAGLIVQQAEATELVGRSVILIRAIKRPWDPINAAESKGRGV